MFTYEELTNNERQQVETNRRATCSRCGHVTPKWESGMDYDANERLYILNDSYPKCEIC